MMTTYTTPTSPTRFLGCDVGKEWVVVHDSADDSIRSIPNRPDALARLLAGLDAGCLVVCEATGGHERALLAACLAAGIPAHRADARKVRAFQRSFGTLAKTDAVDARALTAYGRERHPHLSRWQAPDPDRCSLALLLRTRRELVAARTAWTNRLKAPAADHTLAAIIAALLACLSNQIARLDAMIQSRIARSATLARLNRTLLAIPGIGPHTAAALIALMPELGTLPRRQAASLAGLAPHPKDSGSSRRYRKTTGGRPELKQALFLAALAASRHHPRLAPFHKKLRANGKKPLVAHTAVMRRLLVIANAKVRDALNHQLS